MIRDNTVSLKMSWHYSTDIHRYPGTEVYIFKCFSWEKNLESCIEHRHKKKKKKKERKNRNLFSGIPTEFHHIQTHIAQMLKDPKKMVHLEPRQTFMIDLEGRFCTLY